RSRSTPWPFGAGWPMLLSSGRGILSEKTANGLCTLMRQQLMRRAAPLLALGIALSACSSGPELTYEQEIAAWRAEKDEYMRSSVSPVPPDARPAFPPL